VQETAEHIRTLTTKGQVTIPAEVRRLLGVKPHDKIAFRVSGGTVTLEPTTMTLEATFGAVPPRKHPEDFKELRDTAIEEHVRDVVAEMR
jgi:AbrB family looped-hinge helix DNA binding protein